MCVLHVYLRIIRSIMLILKENHDMQLISWYHRTWQDLFCMNSAANDDVSSRSVGVHITFPSEYWLFVRMLILKLTNGRSCVWFSCNERFLCCVEDSMMTLGFFLLCGWFVFSWHIPRFQSQIYFRVFKQLICITDSLSCWK